ncbi:hypothetical protein MTO96_025791 [Rhipicephalus appendiculatus]
MQLFLGWLEWIVLVVTFCVLCYLYASRNRNYWKSQGVPSEPYALIFGPPLKLLHKPIHEIDAERYDKYGRFFGAFESNKLLLFVAEPELVKKVLVNDFGSLPNRRTFTFLDPLLDNMIAFATGEQELVYLLIMHRLTQMNSLIDECALITTEHLKKAASNEEDIDVKQLFGHYTLDVIARCAFGTRLDSHADQTNEFVTKSTHAFSGRLTPRLFVFFALPVLARVLRIRPFNSKIFLYFKQICQNVMKSRRDNQSLMMDAQEGELSYTAEDAAEHDNHRFILGLDVHPDVQNRLRDEVDECFRVNGDHPSLDVITKLKYMHCVVSESLRMYPAVMRIERSPCRDYILDRTGVKVKKGDLIAIPIYSMHHDPEYFPEPSKFDPERFSDQNLENIRPFTYLPFGEGPRNCIGARLALQAVKLCLLHTIRNVELVRTENTKVPLEFENGFNVVMTAKDITLGIRKRS